MSRPRVSILSSGEELTCGHTADANGPFLAAQLTANGFAVRRIVVVGDDPTALREELVRSAQDSDVVLVTGGLGPTADDRTREAIAEACGAHLVRAEVALEHVRSIIEGHGYKMTEAHARQALFPEGAQLHPNDRGTALGFACRVGRAKVIVMPGVPREMHGMFHQSVLPSLLADAEERTCVTTVNLFGLPESLVDERIGDMMAAGRNPAVGLKVGDGVVCVCLRATAPTDEAARELAGKDARVLEERFGEAAFGRDETTLAQALSEQMERHNVKVAVAESCTGGLVGGLLTDVPGISRFLLADIVAYSNEAKVSLLRVPAGEIESFGAVSPQVAESMARGVCEITGAELGISTTGIAGPTGGSVEKPVGLVYVGICLNGKTTSHELNLRGDRWRIRSRAARYALDLARLALLRCPEKH
jgi:nicotinamide-nucleotide amidase